MGSKRTLGVVLLAATVSVASWSALGPGSAGADESEVWDIVGVEDDAPQRRSIDPFTLDPSAFAALRLDDARLASRLTAATTGGSTTFELPSPSGEMRSFTVESADIFEPELAATFPDIRAYRGEATDGSGDTIRFEVTPDGFRAQVSSADGWWYVDPQTQGDTSVYVSYHKDDLRNPSDWTEDPLIAVYAPDGGSALDGALAAKSNGTELRTYRLAVAADRTYAADHGNTVPGAQAAITTAVNRLNGIYRPELSIRFVLVANNDDLIFLNAGGACAPNGAGPNCDPFGANDGDNLDANQILIDSVIGDANYDIGHVFTGNGCGLAAGASVGDTGRKAQGCSGIVPAVNDPFVVDYVAHEIGHQFGANHTFNGCPAQPGNRVGSVAYEPGSASTILGYAGICGNDDVQKLGEPLNATGASDPYFHSASFDEIVSYTTSPGSDGNLGASNNGNAVPSANAGADGTIPDATPFRLTGRSSDPDGDPLTHRWEQRDLSGEAPLTSPPIASGPVFRSQPATSAPVRNFPKLSALADGNTNLDKTCPAPPANAADRQCWSEFVPVNVDRDLDFRMTVLDGQGGVDTDDMTVTVVDTVSRFEVVAPNGGESVVGGSNFNVTWNAAGTAGAPISATHVNIRASLDDGLTYPYVLATKTANDGSHTVTLPGVAGNTTARIMVESHAEFCGVQFFDVTDATFTLTTGGVVTPPPITAVCAAPPPQPDPPGAFDSLSPERFVDTRPAPEGETLDGQFEGAGKRAAGSEYKVKLAGRGNVPADAKAVVMNITAIATEGIGFVTVHPCVNPLPLASSLNYTPGVNLGNEIVAPLTSGGELCIFTSQAAHIAVDVTGFVDAASDTEPITPRRFLDTRPFPDGQTFDGLEEGQGKLVSGETVFLDVGGRSGVIPADATAVIMNVTAIAAERTGFVTVDPCAPQPPLASSLNYVAGVNRGNEIVASIGPGGLVCLFTSAPAHLTADIVGYLPNGSDLVTIAPGRYLDTRPAPDGETVDGVSQGEGKRSAGSQYTLQLAGRGDIGADAKSVVMNLTAVAADGVGFVTVHPCVNPRPLASSLNYVAGVNGGNEIIAQLSSSGEVCLFTSNTTHLTVDVVGYGT